MYTIFKYVVQPEGAFPVVLPETFKVVSTAVQRDPTGMPKPVLYVLVDNDCKIKSEVVFNVYPTGVDIDPYVARTREYLGLIRLGYEDGPYPDLYFHVFGPRVGGGFAFTPNNTRF